MAYYIFAVVCFLFILYALYKIFRKKEESKKAACIELAITILTMILGTLFQYGVDKIPDIAVIVEKWVNSSDDVENPSSETLDIIPEININIGEMQLEVGDTFKIPYTFDVPEAYSYELVWTSSNLDCLSVDGEGTLTAKSVGQAIIAVSFKNYPDSALKTFRVFVIDGSTSSSGEIQTEYDQICETSINDGKYLIFFNIDNPYKIAINKVVIYLYSDDGMILYEEVFTPPENARSNYAGEFGLEYHGTYLVVGTVITEDGKEYRSEEHILRPYMEIH